MVKNTQKAGLNLGTFGNLKGQGVRTGDNPGGYLLSNVLLPYRSWDADDLVRVTTRKSGETGFGSTAFYMPLEEERSDNRRFSAPAGTILEANKTYWFHNDEDVPVSGTHSSGLDSGAASGWGIEEVRHSSNYNSHFEQPAIPSETRGQRRGSARSPQRPQGLRRHSGGSQSRAVVVAARLLGPSRHHQIPIPLQEILRGGHNIQRLDRCSRQHRHRNRPA